MKNPLGRIIGVLLGVVACAIICAFFLSLYLNGSAWVSRNAATFEVLTDSSDEPIQGGKCLTSGECPPAKEITLESLCTPITCTPEMVLAWRDAGTVSQVEVDEWMREQLTQQQLEEITP